MSRNTTYERGMFQNRGCWYGERAVVKISESTKNPRKLYFTCHNGKCNFFNCWKPPVRGELDVFQSRGETWGDHTHEMRNDQRELLHITKIMLIGCVAIFVCVL